MTDCLNDADAAEGSCQQSCGLPPLNSLPDLGLPAVDSSSSGSMPGLWPIIAMIDAQSLFASAIWEAQHGDGFSGTAANVTTADFLSPVQLGDIVVNQTLFGSLVKRAGLSVGRSPLDVDNMFYQMDFDPRDQVVTPLE